MSATPIPRAPEIAAAMPRATLAQPAAPLVTHAGDPLAGRMDAREWRRWAQMINERGIVIDRPAGYAHPVYPDMIYPCDYGHVPDTSAPDGEDVDVFVGPVPAGLVGLIAVTHQPSGVSEPKLLMNLSVPDAHEIVEFLDRGDPRPDLHLAGARPRPDGHAAACFTDPAGVRASASGVPTPGRDLGTARKTAGCQHENARKLGGFRSD
jgi:inorganic pyrophosphatase